MIRALAILIGAVLGLLITRHARRHGAREPRFWALVLVVMQLIYLAFALFAPDRPGMLREGLVLAVFTVVAVLGSRFSSWFLALGLLAHGAWDLRHLLERQDYVLPFYAELCIGFDWLLFFYLVVSARSMDQRRAAKAQETAA